MISRLDNVAEARDFGISNGVLAPALIVVLEVNLVVGPSMRENGVRRYVVAEELVHLQRLGIDQPHLDSGMGIALKVSDDLKSEGRGQRLAMWLCCMVAQAL